MIEEMSVILRWMKHLKILEFEEISSVFRIEFNNRGAHFEFSG
jgi:hypothetical protein